MRRGRSSAERRRPCYDFFLLMFFVACIMGEVMMMRATNGAH